VAVFMGSYLYRKYRHGKTPGKSIDRELGV
jgi:hypothetical protein